tara:strand:- start:2843 stop:3538 length:696 start_codon:yes stop_codon:yes gene_type:complete
MKIMAQPFDPARAEVSKAFARNFWFRRQPQRLQEALSAAAIPIHAEAGKRLYDAGDDAYGLYGVMTGTVNIHVQMPDGEYALANVVGPGTIFGYAGRLVGKRRLVSAVVRDEARLFYVTEARIETIAQAQPDLWLHFAELASEQLVAATRGMVTNARGTPGDRVAMYLSGMSGEAPEGSAPVRLTQEELAELTGLSRKTVNRVLREMTEKGFIETGYGHVRVLKSAALTTT